MGKGGEFGSIPDSIFLGLGSAGLLDTLRKGAFTNSPAANVDALAQLARTEHAAANAATTDVVSQTVLCVKLDGHLEQLKATPNDGTLLASVLEDLRNLQALWTP